MTGFTQAGTTTAYGWDKVPNRTSVQVGAGSPVATTYDAANRPLNQNGVSGAYVSDADGRLTTQPSATGAGFQRYEWDSLGRLTKVKPPTGGSVIATYTYDPLDRLRLIDYGGSNRVRFRYVGLTTSAAQTIDDQSGAVSRNIGTSWTGERQLDWTATNSNIRYYGSNAHHDTVWTASSTGSVSATLRYDPWGSLTASTGSSLPDFRFQGSWFDTTTSLSWVVTRWYAPALGRFLSEDSLLGTPADPPSRHLYAYGAGEPIGRWDPDGRFWYRWRSGDTIGSVGQRYLGLWGTIGYDRRRAIFTVNQNRAYLRESLHMFAAGQCLWVPREVWISSRIAGQCTPSSTKRTGFIGDLNQPSADTTTQKAATRMLGNWRDWYVLTPSVLYSKIEAQTKRKRDPAGHVSTYRTNEQFGTDYAILGFLANRWSHSALFAPANVVLLWGKPWFTPLTWPSGADAVTYGKYVMLRNGLDPDHVSYSLLAHEYIHVLQWQGRGVYFADSYLRNIKTSFDPGNPEEAPGYLYGAWIKYYYPNYQGRLPWLVFKPLPR